MAKSRFSRGSVDSDVKKARQKQREYLKPLTKREIEAERKRNISKTLAWVEQGQKEIDG